MPWFSGCCHFSICRYRESGHEKALRKGVIQPGQNSNFTAQFGRDIIKLRIKLTCKIAK